MPTEPKSGCHRSAPGEGEDRGSKAGGCRGGEGAGGGMLDGKIEQSGQIGERQIVKAGEREGGGEAILLEIPCVCAGRLCVRGGRDAACAVILFKQSHVSCVR